MSVENRLSDGMFFNQESEKQEFGEKWKLKDFNGFIHMHSRQGSSCGREELTDILRALITKTGLSFFVMSEHVGWPGEEYWPEKILKEFNDIDDLNRECRGVKIFKGIEANVIADGSIDATRDELELADFVVASHHYANIEPESDRTAEATVGRWIAVMNRYPEVNVLGHPLRDLPPDRWEEIDWDRLCRVAKEKGVIIEVGISDAMIEKVDREKYPTIEKDYPPFKFLEALRRNGNLVTIAPDFHYFVNQKTKKPTREEVEAAKLTEATEEEKRKLYAHIKLRDNWLGDRALTLTDEQLVLLKRYYELQGNIAGKTFREQETNDLKGAGFMSDKAPPTEQVVDDLLNLLAEERRELEEIKKSAALKEIYDVLLLSEKITSKNGRIIDRYPLSTSILLRFARRIDRVRKAGISKENLVNLWSEEKLTQWLAQRNVSKMYERTGNADRF